MNDKLVIRFIPYTLHIWLIVILLLTSISVLTVWVVKRILPESSHVAHGASYSFAVSCLACHGQLEGYFPDNTTLTCGVSKAPDSHLSHNGDCTDLLAFFEVARVRKSYQNRLITQYPNRVMQGERMAREFYCFTCHGELGQGGIPNQGAFKGYIPGYFGQDFAHLTQDGDPESIRRWISKGIDNDLYEKPIEGALAKYYINHQAISMPGLYSLTELQLQILVEYVLVLNRFGNMDAKNIRTYSELTQSYN